MAEASAQDHSVTSNTNSVGVDEKPNPAFIIENLPEHLRKGLQGIILQRHVRHNLTSSAEQLAGSERTQAPFPSGSKKDLSVNLKGGARGRKRKPEPEPEPAVPGGTPLSIPYSSKQWCVFLVSKR